MAYLTFQFKKITKNNLVIIAMVILTIISFVILLLNAQTNKEMQLLPQAQDNVKMQKDALVDFQKSIKDLPSTSERYKIAAKNIIDTEKQLKNSQRLVSALKNNDWETVYDLELHNAKQVLNIQKRDHADKEAIDGLTKNMKQFEYLKRHPMSYEASPAKTGYQFLLELNSMYLPILFTLVIIFILTQVYTDSYRNKFDINSLIPMSTFKRNGMDSVLGIGSSIFIFALINLLVFCGASILFGTGNLNYPFAVYHRDAVTFAPTKDMILPILMLQLVMAIFITVTVQFIAKICRKNMLSLLISLLVILGLGIATNVIEPLQKIAQWLPTTYLNAVSVVSGEFASQINNYNINFVTGIIVVLVYSVIIVILNSLVEKIKK